MASHGVTTPVSRKPATMITAAPGCSRPAMSTEAADRTSATPAGTMERTIRSVTRSVSETRRSRPSPRPSRCALPEESRAMASKSRARRRVNAPSAILWLVMRSR